jgi:hypothetical protein
MALLFSRLRESDDVSDLLFRIVEHWWASDFETIPLARIYAPEEQSSHDGRLADFIDTLSQEARRLPRDEAARRGTQERLLQAFGTLGRSSLDLEEAHLHLFQMPGLGGVASDFVQQARRFDPKISGVNISQASRNAWVMHSLQILMDQSPRVTPPILGYSLLYPYSDNYLDDPDVPDEAKAAFSRRLDQRLTDPSVGPANERERFIWDLVAMIESEFHPKKYPEVFTSLRAIHRAQHRSIGLLRQGGSPYEIDVLGISFEKGGTSVVADGYLVTGSLTAAQQEFLFGLGAYLQLLDDLQDVQEDRQCGRLTVFAQTAGRWPLDGLTNRTLAFGLQVLEGIDCFDTPHLAVVKGLMVKSTTLLILEAASQAGSFYSQGYLAHLERHCPFRFATLRRQRQKLTRRRSTLTSLLESLLVSGHVLSEASNAGVRKT